MKFPEKISRYSPVLLRAGLATVFLWFGFSQMKNPSQWTGLIPEYTSSIPISPEIMIYLNGSFEIIFAILLLLGLFTRFTSLLLSLHVFHIVTIVGYGAIGARDLALALATLSIFLHGADEFCLDNLIFKKKE